MKFLSDKTCVWVLLGTKADVAYFALDVSNVRPSSGAPQLIFRLRSAASGGGLCTPARYLLHGRNASVLRYTLHECLIEALTAVGLSEADGAILAQARGLLEWHQRHPFCSKVRIMCERGLSHIQCGGATEVLQGGVKRRCLREGCKREHYPRTDPVAIALVVDPTDRLLLARKKAFPPGANAVRRFSKCTCPYSARPQACGAQSLASSTQASRQRRP